VIAALADGMGGAKGGRVAAELAVRGFIDATLGQPATLGFPRIGARAMDSVNRWIHAIGRTDSELNGMACTLSALVLCGGRAHVLHVGDSRIYRLRDEKLTLLTQDHTLGAPGTTHALTRAVGAQAEPVERDAAGEQVEADVAIRDARTHGPAEARDAEVDQRALHERQVQDEQERDDGQRQRRDQAAQASKPARSYGGVSALLPNSGRWVRYASIDCGSSRSNDTDWPAAIVFNGYAQ
jgi:hypothetical protein